MPFQPTNLIFSAVDVLLGVCASLLFLTVSSCLPIQTAIAVGIGYDVLADLFEYVSNFLRRLRIYFEIPPTPAMSDILIRIMMEVLSVLALATKHMKKGRFSTPLVCHISFFFWLNLA